MSTQKVDYLLRFADSALILSQRLGELCGKGPALEEDMALTNVALDLLGQARLWLSYAGEVEGQGRDEDALAYLRNPNQFRNLLLVEQPNGHYGDTVLRQFFFDAWHELALRALLKSTDERVAAIAEKALKEVSYHLRRSGDLVIRLGDGTEHSHALMQGAADRLWTYTGEMFVSDPVDTAMSADGIGFDARSLAESWLARVREVFFEATLKLPSPDAYMQTGGKTGRHGEVFGYLLAEMQSLPRAYPGARW